MDDALPASAQKVQDALAAASVAAAADVRQLPVAARTAAEAAPIGHPTPIETIVDTDLEHYERIWAAAGTLHSVFSTTFKELLALTRGAAMAVAGDEAPSSDS
jgi:prolyl-tRNA editing enzyme YbaK/EbsC (Cys-tRNA(Pro) deacylase)